MDKALQLITKPESCSSHVDLKVRSTEKKAAKFTKTKPIDSFNSRFPELQKSPFHLPDVFRHPRQYGLRRFRAGGQDGDRRVPLAVREALSPLSQV